MPLLRLEPDHLVSKRFSLVVSFPNLHAFVLAIIIIQTRLPIKRATPELAEIGTEHDEHDREQRFVRM